MRERIKAIARQNNIRLTKAIVEAVKAKATDTTTDAQLLTLIQNATS